jgi:hypothetical protein
LICGPQAEERDTGGKGVKSKRFEIGFGTHLGRSFVYFAGIIKRKVMDEK